MKVKHKLIVVDDYKVEAILNISGFSMEYIENMINEYTEEARKRGSKTDVGHFATWFESRTQARANGYELTITYT